MKRYFYSFIVLFLLCVSVNAQSKKEKEIAALVDAFNDAIIRIDSTALKNMVADELSYGHSSGLVQDKAAFIKGVVNGPNFFKKFDLANKTVKVAGKNAIARHVATAQAINNGAPREIKFGNILIWQKKGGKWRLLARQGYTVM
jgi:ketosteroid isomerase-like protein